MKNGEWESESWKGKRAGEGEWRVKGWVKKVGKDVREGKVTERVGIED